MPWNTYPWFLPDQGGLNRTMIRGATGALRRILEAGPACHTVVTGGNNARDGWTELVAAHPAAADRWRHLHTFHTSTRGITNGGRQTKAEGMAHVVQTLQTAIVPPTRTI